MYNTRGRTFWPRDDTTTLRRATDGRGPWRRRRGARRTDNARTMRTVRDDRSTGSKRGPPAPRPRRIRIADIIIIIIIRPRRVIRRRAAAAAVLVRCTRHRAASGVTELFVSGGPRTKFHRGHVELAYPEPRVYLAVIVRCEEGCHAEI